MLPRLLVAIGTVGASVGFMFLGIGQATPDDLDWMVSLAWILMAVGIVLAVVGAVLYRSSEKAAEALIAARRPDNHRQAG